MMPMVKYPLYDSVTKLNGFVEKFTPKRLLGYDDL